jgi:hypothetical protein
VFLADDLFLATWWHDRLPTRRDDLDHLVHISLVGLRPPRRALVDNTGVVLAERLLTTAP